MRFNSILLLLPILAFTSAIPMALSPRQAVETTYLAVIPGSTCSTTDPYVVANSTITSPYCFEAGSSAYEIARLPSVSCMATVYNGFGCNAGTATSTVNIPAGSGNVCVASGSFLGICSYCPEISISYDCE